MTKIIFFTFLFFISSLLYGQNQNIDSLQQVITTSKDAKAKSESYVAIVNHYRQNDSLLFKKYLKEGLVYARGNSDEKTAIELVFLECKRLNYAGRYKELIPKLDSLIPFAEEQGMYDIQGTMLNYSGGAYAVLSDYTAAIVQYIEYLSVAKKAGKIKPVAMANNNLGMALLNMDRYDQAIPYLNSSLENQKEFDSGFKAHTYWNLGICYMEKRQYEEALEIFKLGVEEAERKGDSYAASGNQLCIGSVYVRQDLFEKGLVAYTHAYTIGKEANLEPFKLIEALNGIIYANNQLSRPQEALPYVLLADSITAKNDLSDLRNREFLFYKSATLLQLGRPQEADVVFSRYEVAVDSLHNAENMEIIQTKETEFRTKEKEQMLQLQRADLDFQRLLTTLLGVGALLLASIGFLVYRQQRLKIKNQRQEQALKEALLTVETNKKLEDQRLRISKELHDNIGSQLTYLASAAQNIGIGMDMKPKEETQNKLKDLSEFSQEAITDLRDTIWVMNRNLVSWEDLTERIRYLAHKVSNTTGIEVTVHKEGEDGHLLDPAQTMNVYRIIQEAVNNAVKHAQAKKIGIRVVAGSPTRIEIIDDGKGYDMKAVNTSSSGLRNMESRANQLGALLDTTSNGDGTRVSLEITISKVA